MAFVTAAIIGGAALAGGIGGAAISAHAAGNAAQTQASAADRATQMQHDMYEEQRGDQAPWRQAGAGALSQMGDPSFQHNFGMSDFQADPGYQFRLQQGQQALERSAAARGGLQTGGTLKALTDYAQGSASQEYQNAYNRFTNDQTNRFNRLSSIAGLGQTANGMTSAAGQNYANNAGQNMMGAATMQGAAGIAGANAWSGTLSGIGKTGMEGMWMNRMYPQGGGGVGGGGAEGGVSVPSVDTSFGYQSPNFGALGG